MDFVKILKDKSSEFIKKDDSKLNKHIIAYMDFLGFKNKIESDDSLVFLKQIKNIYNLTICTYEKTIKEIDNNLNKEFKLNLKTNFSEKIKEHINPDIKYKIFSDNIIIAFEIPQVPNDKEIVKDLYFKMISLCSNFQAMALFEGYLLRGGITVGELYIDDTLVYGKGLVDAYKMENKRAKNPRIIIENEFLKFNLKENINYMKDEDNELFVNYYNSLKTGNIITKNMASYIKTILLNFKNPKNDSEVIEKIEWAIKYHNQYLSLNNKNGYLTNYFI